jgi:small-conductance mechanosensitive channel
VYHLAVACVVIILFLSLTRAVRAFLNFLGRKIISKTETDLDDRILDVVLANVRPAMLVLGLYFSIREAGKGLLEVDPALTGIVDGILAALYVAGILVIVKIGIGISREVVSWYLENASVEGGSALQKTVGPLFSKSLNFLIALVGLIVILDHFGINIGSLLVSLGVGSLAVALAAQETLANMIAGFVILVDRPFRIGDRIDATSGVVGDVLAIGLRSTRVLNFDNNVVIIPNADLVKARVTNFAYPYKEMRILLKFDVAFGTDIQRLRSMVLALARSNPEILKDPEPSLRVVGITENGIHLWLTARAKDFSTQFTAETDLREQIYELLMREGISPAIPQRRIIMTDGKR